MEYKKTKLKNLPQLSTLNDYIVGKKEIDLDRLLLDFFDKENKSINEPVFMKIYIKYFIEKHNIFIVEDNIKQFNEENLEWTTIDSDELEKYIIGDFENYTNRAMTKSGMNELLNRMYKSIHKIELLNYVNIIVGKKVITFDNDLKQLEKSLDNKQVRYCFRTKDNEHFEEEFNKYFQIIKKDQRKEFVATHINSIFKNTNTPMGLIMLSSELGGLGKNTLIDSMIKALRGDYFSSGYTNTKIRESNYDDHFESGVLVLHDLSKNDSLPKNFIEDIKTFSTEESYYTSGKYGKKVKTNEPLTVYVSSNGKLKINHLDKGIQRRIIAFECVEKKLKEYIPKETIMQWTKENIGNLITYVLPTLEEMRNNYKLHKTYQVGEEIKDNLDTILIDYIASEFSEYDFDEKNAVEYNLLLANLTHKNITDHRIKNRFKAREYNQMLTGLGFVNKAVNINGFTKKIWTMEMSKLEEIIKGEI